MFPFSLATHHSMEIQVQNMRQPVCCWDPRCWESKWGQMGWRNHSRAHGNSFLIVLLSLLSNYFWLLLSALLESSLSTPWDSCLYPTNELDKRLFCRGLLSDFLNLASPIKDFSVENEAQSCVHDNCILVWFKLSLMLSRWPHRSQLFGNVALGTLSSSGLETSDLWFVH